MSDARALLSQVADTGFNLGQPGRSFFSC